MGWLKNSEETKEISSKRLHDALKTWDRAMSVHCAQDVPADSCDGLVHHDMALEIIPGLGSASSGIGTGGAAGRGGMGGGGPRRGYCCR